VNVNEQMRSGVADADLPTERLERRTQTPEIDAQKEKHQW